MSRSGLPTIAYRSARPSTDFAAVPDTTRGDASSTACRYASDSAVVTSRCPRSIPSTCFGVGTCPRNVAGPNGSHCAAAAGPAPISSKPATAAIAAPLRFIVPPPDLTKAEP